MRINFVYLLISLIAAGLIFFGFYTWSEPENLLVSIGTGVVSFVLLTSASAVYLSESPRSGLMLRTASAVFFVIMLITDILLAKYDSSDTTFIVVNGLALCLWLMITYGVAKAKQ